MSEAAREAGRQAMLSEPPERRSVDACPFEPGSDERAAWVAGFAEALDEQPDIAALKRQVEQEQA
jgi:ribosome modulation factor